MTEPVQVGDIFVVVVPFIEGTGAKPRPVLVTSLPNSKGDVRGIPGSSRLSQWREPYQIEIGPNDLEVGELGRATVFPASKQMVFSPRLFKGYVGRVNSMCLDQALRAVVAANVDAYDTATRRPSLFQPGKTPIPAGKVIGRRGASAHG